MDICIALRTGVVKDGTLYVQAGGGVVYDSDPEAEFQESVNKAKALTQAARDAGLFVAPRGGNWDALPRQIPLHRRPDLRHDLLARHRDDRRKLQHVAAEREAEQLAADEAGTPRSIGAAGARPGSASPGPRTPPAVCGGDRVHRRRAQEDGQPAALALALPEPEEVPDDRRADRAGRNVAEVRQPEIEVDGAHEERLLAAEVADHQCRIDPGARRDVADRRPLVALCGEELARGGEDRRAGSLGLARWLRGTFHDGTHINRR